MIKSPKNITGTDITITDTKNDTGKITAFECASSQATSILPSTYTQVDYIESTGTQYINTGVKTNLNTRILSELAVTDILSSVVNYSGTVYAGNTGWIVMGSYGENTIAGYFCSTTRSGVTKTFDNNFHVYDIQNGTQKIDTTVTNVSTTTMPTTLDIYLFKSSNNFNGDYSNKQKIKYCKIYTSGTLVRNLIPCYRNSDNVIGMFDIVNNIFYTNAGTGTFTKSSNAVLPNPNFPITIQNTGDGGILNTLVHKKNIHKGGIKSGLYLAGNGAYTTNAVYSCSNLPILVNQGQVITVSTQNNVSGIFYVIEFNGTTFVKSQNSGTNTTSYTCTLGATTNFVKIDVGNSGVPVTPETAGDFQIEYGNAKSAYEPYTGAEYPITLPVGYVGGSLLNGVEDDDEFQRLGKVVLNGSESFTVSATRYTGNIIGFVYSLFDVANLTTDNPCLCNRFKQINTSTGATIESFMNVSGYICFGINKATIGWLVTDTNEQIIVKFKAKLAEWNTAGVPLTLAYDKAVYTPITPALPTITTYADYTAVSSTNVVKANMTVRYNSTDLSVLCSSDTIHYKEYIIINGITIEIKGKMSNSCYNDGNIFGTFIMKKLEFTTENDIEYKKQEFTYWKSVNTKTFKIGTYIVTDVKDNDSDETVTVTSVDYALKSAIPYTTELDYISGEITLYDVLGEACINSGLILLNETITNGDFIVDSNQFTNGELNGDVIKAVSHISGDFATINEDDKVEFVYEKETYEVIEDYVDLDDKRDTHPITSVSIRIKSN